MSIIVILKHNSRPWHQGPFVVPEGVIPVSHHPLGLSTNFHHAKRKIV